ncbi:MAG: methyltransferase domain-containing protein [Treponema sp.]|nr:methyltransferase domain-containing protein [Treponema sp.]
MENNILIVPCCDKERGGGHLTRCVKICGDLRAIGRKAWLFLPDHGETTQVYNLLKSSSFNSEWIITNEQINLKNFDKIIVDRFQTPRDEILKWKEIAPVIGIDEGGRYRDNFDFLIDILIPENMAHPPANIYSPALLKFPANVMEHGTDNDRQKAENTLKILITFGQEDSAGLGMQIINKLIKIKNIKFDITLLKGNLNISYSALKIPGPVRVLDSIPNLAEHLGGYDLIITHYGITAYEALYTRTPVLLAHPTPYHKKLAKAAGFITFSKNIMRGFQFFGGRKKQQINNSEKLSILNNKNYIKEHCEILVKKFKLRENSSLSELINNHTPQVNRHCPVCGGIASAKSVSRLKDRTYRRCSECGIIFMDRTCPPPVEYEREYFFEQYRKQYGKTYLEDFNNIKDSGKHRLKEIVSVLSRGQRARGSQQAHEEGKSILDIGCAYGPFLAAARDEGFSVFGIDPAQDAVNYVREKLGIPAICGFFPDPQLSAPGSRLYDIITLWFTIEHFTDCAAVLAAIKNILKPGGALAFSTPSSSGISGRSCPGRFLAASPADHYTVWSPASCKKALSRAGFKVIKINVCGHHPERFPVLGKFAKTMKSPVYMALLSISIIFRLGDTFEVYAIKV